MAFNRSEVMIGMGSKRRLLSTATHDFAERGLRGEFGQSLVSLGVSVGDVVDVEGMSEDMLCAHSIRYIGDHAPVRVIPGELLAGSATLKESPQHMVPVYDRFSVSHTTLGFDKALRIGLKGIRRQVEDRLSRGDLSEPGADLLNAMLICLDAAASWHRRYVELLGSLIAQSDGATQAHYLRILGNLKNVPENPPSSFAEAIQSLWLLFTFVRLCGNWPGLGRIDQMLGPFLAADLANGKITLDEAREYIAHFWIKGTEWIGGSPFIGSGGDAQHYQNIILGGIDEDGQEVTNDVTYLVLDVIEELRISDYPVAVRINSRTPEKLLRRIAEVQQCGGGIVSVYNEDVVIESLVQFGYPLSEARNYTNDGCWEAIIPGKTCFGYMPFDMLLLLQSALGLNDDEAAIPSYDSFESLYAAFRERLSAHLDQFNLTTDKYSLGGRSAPLVSIFVDDCIERGRGYDNRGPVYSVLAPHAGGLADTANSLLAIKRLVYEQKRVSLEELVGILRADWNGHEELRREVVSRLEGYGNDDDVADEMVRRLFDDFTELASRVREREGVLRPAGISTFGR